MSIFVRSLVVFALYEGPPSQIHLIFILFIVPPMIIHTYVMSMGGKLFRFICKFTFQVNFRSVSHSFCSVRGPSTLDKYNFNFFYSTSYDNTYICDVHRWYALFVLYVNLLSKSIFVRCLAVFALYKGSPTQINLISIFFIIPPMIMHTCVK